MLEAGLPFLDAGLRDLKILAGLRSEHVELRSFSDIMFELSISIGIMEAVVITIVTRGMQFFKRREIICIIAGLAFVLRLPIWVFYTPF